MIETLADLEVHQNAINTVVSKGTRTNRVHNTLLNPEQLHNQQQQQPVRANFWHFPST
jgi:hypothetical protein